MPVGCLQGNQSLQIQGACTWWRPFPALKRRAVSLWASVPWESLFCDSEVAETDHRWPGQAASVDQARLELGEPLPTVLGLEACATMPGGSVFVLSGGPLFESLTTFVL